MKYFIAVLVLAAVACADVSHILNKDNDAQILKQEADVAADSFQYVFETSNGIAAQQSGVLKNVGSESEAINVSGSNQYTAPDGKVYAISYVADENGYQPSGDHLPTPPPPQPIPDYILRSLQYIAEHTPKLVEKKF